MIAANARCHDEGAADDLGVAVGLLLASVCHRQWTLRVRIDSLVRRGSFPDEDSARKLIYLAITRAQQKWRHTYNWSSVLTAFRIHFGERIPDGAI